MRAAARSPPPSRARSTRAAASAGPRAGASWRRRPSCASCASSAPRWSARGRSRASRCWRAPSRARSSTAAISCGAGRSPRIATTASTRWAGWPASSPSTARRTTCSASCARSDRSPRRTATARRSRCSPARSASSRTPRATRDSAIAHFERAVDLHQELELPHDRAELLVSAAAAARAAGRDDQAREWLGRGERQGPPARRPSAAGDGRAGARRARRRRIGRVGVRRPDAPPAADHPPRRRGAHEPRDRGRALPLRAHGRHARPPLADRARLPIPHRRGPQGLGARAARAALTRPFRP